MPTYRRAGSEVTEMAASIMKQFETHQPLLDRKVSIDFILAYPDFDENGEALNDAIKHGGAKALGLCRKLGTKDRAMGRADAEILLDGPFWEGCSEKEASALLDHELHHIAVHPCDNDDLGRPKLKLRKHDYQFGWFKIIAERHGLHSQECQQAKMMMDNAGQLFWPSLVGASVDNVEHAARSVRRAIASPALR